jgi:hypothetical protein
VHRPDPGGRAPGFLLLVGVGEEQRPASGGPAGNEALLLPAAVRADKLVRQPEDLRGGAEILLQADDARPGVVFFEGQDVPDICAPPTVDGLVGVAGDEKVSVIAGELAGDPVLAGVRVLVFVDEDVPVAASEPLADLSVGSEEARRPDEQAVEIESPGGRQALAVGAADLFPAPACGARDEAVATLALADRAAISRRTTAGGNSEDSRFRSLKIARRIAF